jgi:hypothetical protein
MSDGGVWGLSWSELSLWAGLALVGGLGLVGVVSPRWFQSLATHGARWIDCQRALATLDQRVDVDKHLLPHSRWLGAAVVASCLWLGYVLATH